jgi:hypothetical protein
MSAKETDHDLLLLKQLDRQKAIITRLQKKCEHLEKALARPDRLTRKVVQIAIGHREGEDAIEGLPLPEGDRIYALCDDGTIWYNDMSLEKDEWQWWTMHTVPQGPREDIGDAFERP